MKTLAKYFRLFWAFAKASFIADLEYRANFVTRIVTDIFWYSAQIFTFETIFVHTKTIGEWNVAQMRVFLGILFVVDAFYMIFFHDNLDRMSERVRKGEMDLLLVKPVDSQFMLSFQRVSTALIGNLLIGSTWLGYSLYHLPDFEPMRLFWLLLLVPGGLAAVYSVRFIFCATAVIFTKSESLQYMWFQFYKLGMRPDAIYAPWLKLVVMTLIPVALIASIPARALLNPPDLQLFAWVPIWSVALIYFSHRFWRWCLKFYVSASS
jgi:ABC-2 type transport system permease protein